MMQRLQGAAGGDAFTFQAAPAALGLLIHMATGAMADAVFGAAATESGLTRPRNVVAGVATGGRVLVITSFVGLPIAASLLGVEDAITHMAKVVGWGTFTTGHLLDGLALRAVVAAVARSTGSVGVPAGTRGSD